MRNNSDCTFIIRDWSLITGVGVGRGATKREEWGGGGGASVVLAL